MSTVKENFKYIHGDTYVRYFSLPNYESSPITQIYYTVKQDQDNKLVIQKTIGNGIELLSTDDEKRHYMLVLNATCSDKLKAENKYMHDIEVVMNNVKYTVMTGEFTLNKEATTTHCEC